VRREGEEEKKEIYVLQVAVQRLASPETEKEYNNETKNWTLFLQFFRCLLASPSHLQTVYRAARLRVLALLSSILKK